MVKENFPLEVTISKPSNFNCKQCFPCLYLTSVLAGWCSEIVTYPLDLTKTRLQVQGEVAAQALKHHLTIPDAKYRGMTATAIGIAKEEGILKLWQGLTPALLRHTFYNGIRVSLYDYLRKQIIDSKETALPLWKSAICGISAGAVAQYITTPTDLIKIQMQLEGKRKFLGMKTRVPSTAQAFKQIFRESGIRGLWKGSVPNVQRAALVNLGDLTAYDFSKQFLLRKTNMENSSMVHVIASLVAGFAAAVMATPADVIKTRVMNQPTDENGRGLLYRGSIDCASQALQKEGFFGLYKGFVPCWLRMGPWALIFWVSFEGTLSLVGSEGY